MKTIVVISLLIYAYSVYCVIREIVLINKNSLLNEAHKKSHLSILFYYIAFNCFFGYLFFKTIVIDNLMLELVQNNIWLFLIVISQFSTSLTRHFRKERNGEDLILNYKDELNKSLNFGFSKHQEFELIANDFIQRTGVLGKDVFYIDSSNANIDPFKFLKKDEKLDFGSNTYLIKKTDEIKHDYKYTNVQPLVFGLHKHKYFDETITPLKKTINVYLIEKNKLNFYKVAVGQSFTIKKGIFHGVIFDKNNAIDLQWN